MDSKHHIVSTDNLLKRHNAEDEIQSQGAPSPAFSRFFPDDSASTLAVNDWGLEARPSEKKADTKGATSTKAAREDLPAYTLKAAYSLQEFGKESESTDKDVKPDIEERKATWLHFYQICWQWKAEVAFLLISICSLFAIIALLSIADGIAQDSWPFFLSINTVISILGTASRASLATAVGSCLAQEKWNWFLKRQDHLLMFDRIESASRGEIGSFRLLFSLKFRYWASLGAAIVVILLAYDPFIQSLVDQSGQLKRLDSPQPAIIAEAPGLDVGMLMESGAVYAWQWMSAGNNSTCTRTTNGNDFHSQPDLGMISSMYDGFSNESTSTTRTPISACSTGNCTWPQFASLAVCGSCRDVSQYIKSSTVYVSTGSQAGNQTTFFLPLNNITGGDSGATYSAVGKLRVRNSASFIPASMTAMGTVNASDLVSFADSSTFLMGFSIIYADEAFLNGSVEWDASSPTGMECGLELCTKIYESRVEGGLLTEKVLSSSIHRDPQSLRPEIHSIYPDPNGACDEMWNTVVNESLWYDTETIGNVPRSDLRLVVPDDDLKEFNITRASHTSFNITDTALRSTLSWMKSQFTTQQLIWYENFDESYLGKIDGTTFWEQAPITSALSNRTGMESTFERVADSMTTWMRNIGLDQEPVTGATWSWISHINVIWAYIAFPAVLTLAGCLYCLVVILETRHLGLKPWTDSCLATMAYGIGDDTRARLQQAENIQKEARNVHMGARWTRGWKECGPLK